MYTDYLGSGNEMFAVVEANGRRWSTESLSFLVQMVDCGRLAGCPLFLWLKYEYIRMWD
jgi:hypothetical protein